MKFYVLTHNFHIFKFNIKLFLKWSIYFLYIFVINDDYKLITLIIIFMSNHIIK